MEAIQREREAKLESLRLQLEESNRGRRVSIKPEVVPNVVKQEDGILVRQNGMGMDVGGKKIANGEREQRNNEVMNASKDYMDYWEKWQRELDEYCEKDTRDRAAKFGIKLVEPEFELGKPIFEYGKEFNPVLREEGTRVSVKKEVRSQVSQNVCKQRDEIAVKPRGTEVEVVDNGKSIVDDKWRKSGPGRREAECWPNGKDDITEKSNNNRVNSQGLAREKMFVQSGIKDWSDVGSVESIWEEDSDTSSLGKRGKETLEVECVEQETSSAVLSVLGGRLDRRSEEIHLVSLDQCDTDEEKLRKEVLKCFGLDGGSVVEGEGKGKFQQLKFECVNGSLALEGEFARIVVEKRRKGLVNGKSSVKKVGRSRDDKRNWKRCRKKRKCDEKSRKERLCRKGSRMKANSCKPYGKAGNGWKSGRKKRKQLGANYVVNHSDKIIYDKKSQVTFIKFDCSHGIGNCMTSNCLSSFEH